jgi:putative restriction endonuclease
LGQAPRPVHCGNRVVPPRRPGKRCGILPIQLMSAELPAGPVPETDRTAIIKARKGQGLFKDRVSKIETKCRITGVQNPVHPVASHCKPWRDSTNDEHLNGENGLLLRPSIDHLFDRGFIGFEDNGRLIISPMAHRPSLQRLGIDTASAVNVGGFTSGQRAFLEFLRNAVLLQAIRR